MPVFSCLISNSFDLRELKNGSVILSYTELTTLLFISGSVLLVIEAAINSVVPLMLATSSTNLDFDFL